MAASDRHTIAPVEITRDYRLDLYRGFALWLIFLAHVPGTFLQRLTPWHYGVSDAAEIFVFVSGYTTAYVYGHVMEQRGFLVSAAQIWRRAFEIYVAHIFLFVVFIGEIAYLSHGSHAFDDAMNVRIFHEHPAESILAVLQLKFMPVNMDVLPLYIVLLLVSPLLLWLLRHRPALALTTVGVVYVAANLHGLNLPSYPRGHWYFNPFAWQLVFVVAAWCALGAADWVWQVVHSKMVFGLASVYVLLGFMGFAIVNQFGLGDYVPEWIVVCFGKTNLGILRLLHFLAIAIVINQLIPSDWAPLTGRVLYPFILCGQHSLEIFSLGVTLAFAGYVVIVGNSDSSMARFLVTVAGTVTMVAVAALMSWYKSTRVSFRVVDRRLPARALGDAGPIPGMPVRSPSPAAVAPAPQG